MAITCTCTSFPSHIEDGEGIGDFSSEAAQIVDSSVLVIVYVMREFKNGNYQNHRGVCTFQISISPRISHMTGFWVVVEEKEMYGTVDYTREI